MSLRSPAKERSRDLPASLASPVNLRTMRTDLPARTRAPPETTRSQDLLVPTVRTVTSSSVTVVMPTTTEVATVAVTTEVAEVAIAAQRTAAVAASVAMAKTAVTVADTAARTARPPRAPAMLTRDPPDATVITSSVVVAVASEATARTVAVKTAVALPRPAPSTASSRRTDYESTPTHRKDAR